MLGNKFCGIVIMGGLVVAILAIATLGPRCGERHAPTIKVGNMVIAGCDR